TPEQRLTAEAALKEAQSPDLWGPDVVTEISGPARFWEAEASHHDFFTRNPSNAYCNAVVAPKLQKARRQFLSLMRDDM
ncbi:peptide-methionine (S)-S-oxide reductase, partial [Sorlinia euscelidii]